MIDLNLKRLSPLVYLVLMACLLSGLGRVHAQVDTEFWFVAPEVWANHGDSPTLLRFATFDQAAGWEPTPEEAVEGTYYYEVVINRNEGDLSITDENGTTTFTEPGPIRLFGSLTLVR